MPELPEVETIKRDLEKRVVGLTIEDVVIFDKRIIGSRNPKDFIQAIRNKTIRSVSRRGKVLIIELTERFYWVVHLKMTGQLIYGNNLKETENLKETKVVFKLSNGKCLNYNDQRLFGRLWAVKSLGEIGLLNRLGPEPLNGEFSVEFLKENMARRKSAVKTTLLDQSFVAGIGNIYASEILFKAHISPTKRCDRIKKGEIKNLFDATRSVLEEAILLRGSSMRNYRDTNGEKGGFMSRVNVYAKAGDACPQCKNTIKKIVQGQRSTFYCSNCQK